MDDQPTAIPDKLPHVKDVKESLKEWLISSPMGWFTKPTNLVLKDDPGIWICGSQVWRRALGIQPPDPMTDLDVIVPNVTVLEEFVRNWRVYDPKNYQIELNPARNRLGMGDGVRLMNSTGRRRLIDVWSIPSGMSIAEHIALFPHPCQRVAFNPYLSVHVPGWASSDEAPWILRLVRAPIGIQPKQKSGSTSGKKVPGIIDGTPLRFELPPPPTALDRLRDETITGKSSSHDLVYRALGTSPQSLGVSPPSREKMAQALSGSHSEEANVEGWTVRRCRHCNDPVAGGPTICGPCEKAMPYGEGALPIEME